MDRTFATRGARDGRRIGSSVSIPWPTGVLWAGMFLAVTIASLMASRSMAAEPPGPPWVAPAALPPATYQGPFAAAQPVPFAVSAPLSSASAGLDAVEFRDIGLAEALPTSCERAVVRPVAYQVPVVTPEPVPMPPGVPAPLPKSSAKLDVVEFRGIALEAALRAFAEQTGLNIVASPEASKTQVTIYLRNVTADGRPGCDV